MEGETRKRVFVRGWEKAGMITIQLEQMPYCFKRILTNLGGWPVFVVLGGYQEDDSDQFMSSDN